MTVLRKGGIPGRDTREAYPGSTFINFLIRNVRTLGPGRGEASLPERC